MIFYIGIYFFLWINHANEDGTWRWRGPNCSWSHALRTSWHPKRSWPNSSVSSNIRANRRPAVTHLNHANPGGCGAASPPNHIRQNRRHTQPHRPHLVGGSVQNGLWRGVCQTYTSWRLRHKDWWRCHGHRLHAHETGAQSQARRQRHLQDGVARDCAGCGNSET